MQRNRRRSLSEMTPVGRMLDLLRRERGQTVTDFAESSGVSHALLSMITYGSKRLSSAILERLRANLGLSENDVDRLRGLGTETQEMLTDHLLVPADRLIRREAEEDISEVWVLDREPLEEYDSTWLEHVLSNLRRGCRYIYFVPHQPKAETIALCLRQGLERTATEHVDVMLNFVIVPALLHPHFFNPIRVVWHLREKPKVLGAWAFSSHKAPLAEWGVLMEKRTAYAMRDEYARILDRLRRSQRSLADYSPELSLVETRLQVQKSA